MGRCARLDLGPRCASSLSLPLGDTDHIDDLSTTTREQIPMLTRDPASPCAISGIADVVPMIRCSGFVFYELRPSRHLRLLSAWIGWPSDASLSRVMEAVEQTSCGPPHVLYRFSGKARLLRDDLSRRLG